MKKRILLLALCGLTVAGFTACSKVQATEMDGQAVENEDNMDIEAIRNQEVPEWKFSRNVARYYAEDGWIYVFEYQYRKGEVLIEEGDIPFVFYKTNIRYDLDYSEAFERDMQIIMDTLDYNNGKVTKEELLALNPDDYTFEELDKDIFFGLMNEALNGEAHKEGPHELMSHDLLREPEFSDGYKIQIGYVSQMGVMDKVHIDVLYENGDSPEGFVQLSDIVDDGMATEEQKQLYQKLQDIADGVVANNDMVYDYEMNNDLIISGVDLSRVYTFLYDIGDFKWDKYYLPFDPEELERIG